MSGFAPLIYSYTLFSIAHMIKQSGLPYYFAEGFFYLTGALICAVSLPALQFIKVDTDVFGLLD